MKHERPGRTTRRKPVWALALAMPLAMVAAGCGAGGGSQEQADGGKCQGSQIKVGVVNSSSDAILFIARDKGYLKEEGIEAEFVPFDSAAKMIAPLGSGKLHVGAGAPSAGFYNAVDRGVNIQIVADKGSMPEGYGYMPLLVRKDLADSGQVSSPADLAGMKVAEPAQATATSSTLGTILDGSGLSYDDVEHQFLGFPEHVTAFQNKAIAASMTTEPSATVAEERGVAVRLADPTDVYPNQQLSVALYSDDFAERNKATATCFMKAYLRAARDYGAATEGGEWGDGERADQLAGLVAKAIGMDEDLYKKVKPNYTHPDGQVNEQSLRRDYEFFESEDLLQADVSVGDLVNTSFADAAVKELGPSESP